MHAFLRAAHRLSNERYVDKVVQIFVFNPEVLMYTPFLKFQQKTKLHRTFNEHVQFGAKAVRKRPFWERWIFPDFWSVTGGAALGNATYLSVNFSYNWPTFRTAHS